MYKRQDVGREVAEKIYERHCFFTEQLIAAGVDPKTAEADACQKMCIRDREWNIIMRAVRSLYALSEKESSL